MHIPYAEFISIVYDRLEVESASLKMYHTCKFDPSMLVLLKDDAKMRKMFRFNENYCFVYMSSNTNVSVEVIPPPPRYIKFS